MSPTKTLIDLVEGYGSMREQRYGGVLALAWELGRQPLQREVAERFGFSRSYANSIMNDPDGTNERARKDRYRGTCERCGSKTDGSNGPGKAPKVCGRCLMRDPDAAIHRAPVRARSVWNEQKCLDAIVGWVERNGRLPRTVDFLRAEPGVTPCYQSIVRYCYRYEQRVTRWTDSDGNVRMRRWIQLTRSLPDVLVELAPRLPLAAALTARNAWLRARLFETLGIERIVTELGERIGRDDFGTLWRLDAEAWDEPIVMVQVLNSTPEPDGTFKDYFLRVPPDTETARAAVAWTFDLPAEEYALVVQT